MGARGTRGRNRSGSCCRALEDFLCSAIVIRPFAWGAENAAPWYFPFRENLARNALPAAAGQAGGLLHLIYRQDCIKSLEILLDFFLFFGENRRACHFLPAAGNQDTAAAAFFLSMVAMRAKETLLPRPIKVQSSSVSG